MGKHYGARKAVINFYFLAITGRRLRNLCSYIVLKLTDMRIRMWYALLPRLYKLCFAVALLLFLVNVPPIRRIIEVNFNHFLYVTGYGQWIEEWQFFGWRYEDRIEAFDEYRHHPYYKKDSVLYRVDAINPLKFWWWYDYVTHARWQLPYNSRPDTLPVNSHSIGSEPKPLPN